MREGEERAFLIKQSSVKRLLKEIAYYQCELQEMQEEEQRLPADAADLRYLRGNLEGRRQETLVALQSAKDSLERFIGEIREMMKNNEDLQIADPSLKEAICQ